MKHLFLSFAILFLSALSTHAKSGGPEAAPEARDLVAQAMVENQANHLAIYTKGLVCSSCGIGLRVHLKKLKGVDTSQLDKGVDLDAEKQLVLVAFKSASEIDPEGVREAIYKAGYDPAHYYLWNEQDGVTQTAYPVAQ
jgi:hypothetical protein